MGKVIIVLLLLFGGCQYAQHVSNQQSYARQEAENQKRREATAAEAEAIKKARVDQFNQQRTKLLEETKKFVAQKEWRLAKQEMEPWTSQIPKDDPDFGPLQAKVSSEVLALEKKEAAIAAADDRKRRKKEGVRIGMSAEEVLMSNWGRPERVNRSVYAHGTREQWVYGSGQYLYFENGRLTSLQTSR